MIENTNAFISEEKRIGTIYQDPDKHSKNYGPENIRVEGTNYDRDINVNKTKETNN